MRFLVAAIALLAALSVPHPCPAASSEDVVLGMVGAINDRDWDALADRVADDVRRHSGATPGLKVESRADFEAMLRRDFVSFPDAVQEVNRIFSSGDLVALHATYRGTQDGAMGPFPATGKTLVLPFLALVRVEDDRVAEIWVEWDNVNALTQLGHFPPPSAGEGTMQSRIVPASCGQCQFGMEGEGCTLAVKIDGQAWFVDGTAIDDHGDAHASDGFCEAVRQAEVTGTVRDGRFHATAFRLVPLTDE